MAGDEQLTGERQAGDQGWGAHRPHPLSLLRGEFIWEGKYDAAGRMRVADASSFVLPLEVSERIDGPRGQTAASGQVGLFAPAPRFEAQLRNRLIWGDNKTVLASLVAEFRERIDLIYIDPPFDVGIDFTLAREIGERGDARELELVAYRDRWGRGAESYMQMMAERLTLMRMLLSERGSIYVHCDWRVNMYLRSLLDEVFGKERFRNQIEWCYTSPGRNTERFKPCHDSIFYYSKGPNPIWTNPQQPLAEATLKVQSLRFKGQKETWTRSRDTKDMVDWWDIPFHTGSGERLGYPTQKPEALLERILAASTEPDSLVADFFCGSGTLGAVAERMGRRWILADIGRAAVQTTARRLTGLQRELSEAGCAPRAIDVWSCGHHEAHRWFTRRFAGDSARYQTHIIEQFGATPTTDRSSMVHGHRGRVPCHVIEVGARLDGTYAERLAAALNADSRAYILAFDWPFELHAIVQEVRARSGVTLVPVTLPRELLDDGRSALPPWSERINVDVSLVERDDGGFDVRLDAARLNVIDEALAAREDLASVWHGLEAIDQWSIDFDWREGEPLRHHWQDFRTRKQRSLLQESTASYRYETTGPHTICVRVVDILGQCADVLLTHTVHG